MSTRDRDPHRPTGFDPGRSPVPFPDDPDPDLAHHSDGGRERIGADGLTTDEWLVWDWTRRVDDRLDTVLADCYDLADRVHYLSATVIVSFLVIVAAVGVGLALVLT